MELEEQREFAVASAFQSALVVSEVRFLCDSLIDLLTQCAAIPTCQRAATHDEALCRVGTMSQVVVLLDVSFPGGTMMAAKLRTANPHACVVALGVRETAENVLAWAEAGVAGYVPNTSSVHDLVSLIQQIRRGEQSCPARIAGSLLRRVADGGPRPHSRNPPEKPLTRRETQVLNLVNAGMSNKDIARSLRISVSTTKTHVHNVLGKMHAARRANVMVRARDEFLPHESSA